MGSFLKIQNILAQMMWGSTKAPSDEPEQESEDTPPTSDEPEDTPPTSDTADDPLADSRNRVPTLGGPYGMVLPSGGWRRS